MAQLVKNPPATRETRVQSLGWEDPLEKGTNSYPLQYSGLENSIVHGVAESDRTERLSRSARNHTHNSPSHRRLILAWS